ncbi:MAG: phosphodiester glycosidase family protein, partial [Chloroflexota bacterium]
DDLGELPLFADFEEQFKGQYSGWRKWYDFLERLKTLVGAKEIGIYTAYYYWSANAPNSIAQSSNLEYFHQYPLWIANYGAAEPLVPKPWSKQEWLFWQFSKVGNGKAYGVESAAIDLNYFNGDLPAFQARFPMPDPEPAPDPAPPPPPVETTGREYRVTVASLKIRQGPGLLFDTIGYLTKGDIVEEVASTADRTWLQILRADGLVGWCFGEYLESVDQPRVPPEPPPTIDYWYKATVSNLPVYKEPSKTSPVIAFLQQDDFVPIFGDMTDDGWGRIERVDGLNGWCQRVLLTPVSQEYPELIRQALSPGVTYYRKEISSPRKTIVHILDVSLRAAMFEFLVTPADSNGILCSRTTSQFLSEFGMNFAVNGDAYSYLGAPKARPLHANSGGDFVRPNGFAASRGRIYSRRRGPTFFIDKRNKAEFIIPMRKIYNAVSGDRILTLKGKLNQELPDDPANPRTSIGLNSDGNTLNLVVVDGRQPGVSEGLSLRELANLMAELGCWSSINMDGGGSSAMVIKGFDGNPRVINTPMDQNTPGKERAVANHLGIKIVSKSKSFLSL